MKTTFLFRGFHRRFGCPKSVRRVRADDRKRGLGILEGSNYEGGKSDGWQYQVIFAGTNLQATYDMLRDFLAQEGYDSLPLPATTDELLLFRLPTKREQILLFGENGYAHNPVKILFKADEKKPKTLILCIFNEKEPQHLLRFHHKIL